MARRRLKRDFKITPFPIRLVDERVPKRPSGPYAYFVKAKRSDTTVESGTTFGKELSEQWHALSLTEKKPYQDLATADYARFHKEMEKLSI